MHSGAHGVPEEKRMRVYKFLCAKFGMKSLKEKRLKISTVDDLNDPFELFAYEQTTKAKRKGFRDARQTWAASRGLICFSADWKDPVMWAHYSDKHKGLCLAFEIPENVVEPITYVDKRLSLSQDLNLKDANAWLHTKYENWAYEKELRSWINLETPSEGLYFMDFGERLKLMSVIAGARCTLTKGEILDAMVPLKGVELIKARAGFHRFEIVRDKSAF
jgi:hypothetical protein